MIAPFQKHNSGFTLVELMVSLSIFAIVMTVSIGTLLVMIDANAKAQALNSATMNLTIALDSMTRTIRTGYHYYCTNATVDTLSVDDMQGDYYNDCTDGESRLEVTRGDSVSRIGYRLRDDSNGIGIIEVKEGSGNWLPLTSSDVDITDLSFVVSGAEPYYTDGNYNSGSDTEQPSVNLFIRGRATNDNGLDVPTEFNIQTRLVQQRPDFI